jgi:hypothetical protein
MRSERERCTYGKRKTIMTPKIWKADYSIFKVGHGADEQRDKYVKEGERG